MTEPGLATPAAPPTSPPVELPTVVSALPALSVPAPATAPPVSAPPAPPTKPAEVVSDDGAMPEPATPEPATPEPATPEPRFQGRRPEAAAEEPETVDEPEHEAEHEAENESTTGPSLGLGVLLPLALIWLGATMWAAHASIAERASPSEVMASTAALALPQVIASSLLAGATAGLAALSRWARGGRLFRRAGVAVGAAMALGIAAAAVILAVYGAPPAVMILATTVGGAALLGGLLALIRPTAAMVAGAAATLAYFGVATALSYYQSPLKPIFGGGDTVESRVAAADRFSQAAALIGGITAGLVAFAYLWRRARGARWPTYLLAGAIPGLLALTAEVLTRVGGGPLLRAVAGLSVDNAWVNDYLDSARINSVLTVGFGGAIVATIAVGMTMRRPADEPPADAGAPPADADKPDGS